ncbi:MAG: 4Fe-4S double cluster binding domain-containing protein [Chloroflexota bacterium]|nr:4Fe-4S double cluster binding domain-containing protein [Chloroflexota bacterium]
MALKEEIKAYAREQGADLVGVAAAATLEAAPPGQRPSELLPRAQSVVVMALHVPRGAVASPNLRLYRYSTNVVEQTLSSIAHRMTYLLEEKGYQAIAVPPDVPLDMQRPTGLVPDLSHKKAAEAAGLGRMGRSTLLLTRRFGPRVRLISVVTEAPLEADPTAEMDPCRDCFLCVQACPASALTQEGEIDKLKCLRTCMPYGVGGLLRFVRELTEAEGGEKKKALLRDPRALEFHQFLRSGYYACAQCVKVCPL